MPGYGVLGPTEGRGLLPWSWAEERLIATRNYWVVSVWPDGRPHSLPVWGDWYDTSFWFSSSGRSRKVRNLTADSRCVITTENALEPVMVEGTAELISGAESLATLIRQINAKYATDYSVDMVNPATSATFRVQPCWAFGLTEDDFSGSPTRWVFGREVQELTGSGGF